MFKNFKEFAMRGNVIDLATGVVIGGAFGKIVTSLVNDIIMPLIGLILGGRSFEDRVLSLGEGLEGELLLRYGAFMQSIVDFVIIAFSIFLFITLISKLKRNKVVEEEIKETIIPSQEEILLTEIRDLLQKQ